MKFSQRIGLTPVRDVIQINDIDDILKNRIWNCFISNYFRILAERELNDQYKEGNRPIFCRIFWVNFFLNKIDEVPTDAYGYVSTKEVLQKIKDWFNSAKWFEIYDFVEFVANLENINPRVKTNFISNCNQYLEAELSGFRIIDGIVTPIISEIEIESIEEAINSKKINPEVIHLKAALGYLADRKNPDYRNSVKESISAVEAICCKIAGNEKLTLGKALKRIQAKHPMHVAFKEALEKIYGFASDAAGIRHSLMKNDIDIKFEDAKFMLVACSAFINYLKAKM